MKNLFLILTANIMLFNVQAQNKIYNNSGNESFAKEEIEIYFEKSTIKFPQEKGTEMAASLIALLPTVVDVAFQLTTSSIEKNVKKFTAEYSKQKSYLDAGTDTVPNFKIKRTLELGDGTKDVNAVEISFKAKKIKGFSNGIVYYIEYIDLNYASAKTKGNKNNLDYSIEIKPTFLVNGEKKVQELSPITVSSVEFNKNVFDTLKHRTDIIPLPEGGKFTELSLKIVETNPKKVRAEKILSFWNDNKESAKTIVNNFLPKEEDKDDEASGTSTSSAGTTNNNASTGNK